MNTIYDHLDMFTGILDLLENHLGTNCEIVLHDNTQPYEHSIVDIRNGHVTGRKIGDCGGNWGLEVLSKMCNDTHIYNKIVHMRNGKIIRGSSMFIQDDDGVNIGAICINMDITDTLKCEEYLKQLNMYATPAPSATELFSSDVNQLLDNLLRQCENMFDKPISHLNKDEKMQIIHFLDTKGAFLITKSGDKVCDFLNISKFTLYNYLENTRQSIDK